jgi:hypothetical protein
MKTNIFLLTIFVAWGVAHTALGQQNSVLMEAMNQEIQRGMQGLKLDQMPAPCFISYTISEASTLEITASLGAILSSSEKPFRTVEGRVLVGENGITNENFLDESSLYRYEITINSLPLSGNKDDIRRAIWLTTDKDYKSAVSEYEAKKSAISQQSLPEEEKDLLDFIAVPASNIIQDFRNSEFNKSQMETLARNLSAVFLGYPAIHNSNVSIVLYDARVSFASSEGTTAVYPLKIAMLTAKAWSQGSTGENFNEEWVLFTPESADWPEESVLQAGVKSVADKLVLLLDAPMVKESYSGPVLFEGQAAAELVVQKFFSDVNGLTAIRKPVAESYMVTMMSPDRFKENGLESMMNKKVISRDLSFIAYPQLSSYNNIPLVGSSIVDAEGVATPDSVVLVDRGMMKNLLSRRTPTPKISHSNGHARPAISNGGIIAAQGPSVVKLINHNPLTMADTKTMKEKLIAAAREEGLDYAYIVRKVASFPAQQSSSSGSLSISKLLEVYRVWVADGREELVSMAELDGISVKSFKRVIATSTEEQVYNTLVDPVRVYLFTWEFKTAGVPSSFILPNGILLEDLEIKPAKRDLVKTPPVVDNPLNAK